MTEHIWDSWVVPTLLKYNKILSVFFFFFFFFQLCVWDINKVSSKIAEFILPEGSTGLMYYKIVKELGIHNMDELPYVKLLASDSEGEFMLTCGASGLMIYKVRAWSILRQCSISIPPESVRKQVFLCGSYTGRIWDEVVDLCCVSYLLWKVLQILREFQGIYGSVFFRKFSDLRRTAAFIYNYSGRQLLEIFLTILLNLLTTNVLII